jgi:hypothetical protein
MLQEHFFPKFSQVFGFKNEQKYLSMGSYVYIA